jgi:hypothetical protein
MINLSGNYGKDLLRLQMVPICIVNQKRQEINDTKTATDKTNNKQAKRDSNNDYTEYFEAWLALQTTYAIAIAIADETFYDTVIVANTDYNETVTKADKKYNDDYCRLTGHYYDTLLAIDTGGTVDGNFYNNGTSSLNIQVCFPAGTPVILADGTTKNIEDILPDDLVKTVDHQNPSGKIVTGCVTRIFKNDPQSLWRLNFGTFEIRATKEHPFYVKGKGWITAEELQIGDVLRSASDTEITLIAKEYEVDKVPVFNFEVENSHTYFVGNNITKNVLVHNVCDEPNPSYPSFFKIDPVEIFTPNNPAITPRIEQYKLEVDFSSKLPEKASTELNGKSLFNLGAIKLVEVGKKHASKDPNAVEPITSFDFGKIGGTKIFTIPFANGTLEVRGKVDFSDGSDTLDNLSHSQYSKLLHDATYFVGGIYNIGSITTSMGITIGSDRREFNTNIRIGTNNDWFIGIGFELQNLPSKGISGSIDFIKKY